MDFHPAASIFPLMQGEEFGNLVRDIAENGLMEPIVTHEGKIIDGRNRYRACLESGIKPRFIEFDGSIPVINFIISLRRGYAYSRGGTVRRSDGVNAQAPFAACSTRSARELRKR